MPHIDNEKVIKIFRCPMTDNMATKLHKINLVRKHFCPFSYFFTFIVLFIAFCVQPSLVALVHPPFLSQTYLSEAVPPQSISIRCFSLFS